MPTDTPIPTSAAVQQAHLPSQQDAPSAGLLSSSISHGNGQAIPTPSEPDTCLRNRATRIASDLIAQRRVSDDEILQHIEDCRFLMESAHDRSMALGGDAKLSRDYAEALQWMRLRDQALQALSPAYKRAREAEILRAAASEPGGTGATNEGHKA